MLGLANALSTASSTSEQLYGLSLDGSGDYLEASDLALVGSNFPATGSISFWVKGDFSSQGINAGDLFDKYDGVDFRNHIFIRDYTGSVLQIACQDDTDPPAGYRATGIITVIDGQWNHVVVTWDTTSAEKFKGYVNGNPDPVVDANIDVSGGWTPDGQVVKFGDGHDGSMDEIAIFNAVLDGDAVEALYNSGKPFDLNNDRGNYDNSSALVGYWRMGNGSFDDIANGVAHDAHNPGYGSELWDGTQGDDANWVEQGTNELDEDDGAVKITYVDHSGGAYIYLRDTNDLNTDLTVGATYKLTFQTKVNTGTINWIVRDGAASGYVEYTPSTTTTNTDFESREIYFVAQHTTNVFMFSSSMDNGEIAWIKNISLKKLNGYPGLTSIDENATFTTDTPDDQAMSTVMRLDGTSDYLNMGDALDFGTNDFVISLWHKVADYSVETAHLISKYEDASNFWYIAQKNDGTFGVSVQNGGNNTLNDATADASALEGTWVNIIVVCDRSESDGAVIYINGATTLGKSAFAPDDDDSPEDISISADLTIGAKTGGTPAVLGYIDEVAIWQDADLSDFDDNAAAAIYAAGRSYDLTADTGNYHHSDKLVGYWRMGDGTNDDLTNGFIFDQTDTTISETNLIPQPGFETYDGWIAAPGDGTSAVDTSFSHSGSNSWKVTYDGGDDDGGTNNGVKTPSVPYLAVEVNTVYRLSWWSYVPIGNNNAWVQVSKTAGNAWTNISTGNAHYGETITKGVWQKVTTLFRTASTGTTIQLSFNNGAAEGADGDIRWFDDIELVKVGSDLGVAATAATMIRQPV